MRQDKKNEGRNTFIINSVSTPRKRPTSTTLGRTGKGHLQPAILPVDSSVGKYFECAQETIVMPPASEQPPKFPPRCWQVTTINSCQSQGFVRQQARACSKCGRRWVNSNNISVVASKVACYNSSVFPTLNAHFSEQRLFFGQVAASQKLQNVAEYPPGRRSIAIGEQYIAP